MTRNQLIDAILENLSLTKRAMTARVQHMMRAMPVSPAQLEMLYIIRNLQPVSTKLLSTERQLTPGAVSQLTDALVQQKLVVRKADATDRRSHTLTITRNGEKLLHGMQKKRDELFKRAMRNFTDEELEVWLRIQQKVISELEVEKIHTPTKGTK